MPTHPDDTRLPTSADTLNVCRTNYQNQDYYRIAELSPLKPRTIIELLPKSLRLIRTLSHHQRLFSKYFFILLHHQIERLIGSDINDPNDSWGSKSYLGKRKRRLATGKKEITQIIYPYINTICFKYEKQQ